MAHCRAEESHDRIGATTTEKDQADVVGHHVNAALVDSDDWHVSKSPEPPSSVVAIAVGSHSCRLQARGTIKSLPPELLLMIFLLLQYPPNFSVMGGGSGLGWLVVTHVCSSWRHVAIGAPWLWANIPSVFGQEWMRLALKRSQLAPINMHFFYPGLLLDMEEEVLSNFFRLKYLNLSDDWHVLQCFLHKMVKDAPDLEDLRIEGVETNGRKIRRPRDRLDIERKGRQVSFPPDLLDGHAPHLRHLELCRSSLPGAFPIFRGLTSLVLEDLYPALEFPVTDDPSSTTPSPPLTSSGLLTFLENTPALTTLQLTNVFWPDLLDSAHRLRTGRKVRLSCLQTLHVKAPGLGYILFWYLIVIPAACRVEVTAASDESFDTMSTIVTTISRHCFQRPQPFTHVEVLFNDDFSDEVCIGFHPEFFHPPNVYDSCHSQVGLVCPPQHRPQFYRQIICEVLCTLPGIRSISIDERLRRVLTVADFANFFGSPNLDSVHTVRLNFFQVDAFSAFLQMMRVVTLDTDERVTVPMMQGLKTLVMGDNEPCEWGHR
ncbi:hypothetical protein EWM64_g9915, partial [Hericium alpestre]